jgi:hypothetical protein
MAIGVTGASGGVGLRVQRHLLHRPNRHESSRSRAGLTPSLALQPPKALELVRTPGARA